MLPLEEIDAAEVMAHAPAHDRARLHELLGVEGLRYLGVLGPRLRTLELLEGTTAGASGVLPGNVYAPVGLDLGAETPEEIALSIVSEIAAVLAERTPRSLRERGGPIHEERASSVATTARIPRAMNCGGSTGGCWGGRIGRTSRSTTRKPTFAAC